MPVHDFRCPAGHTFEALVGQGVDWLFCERCKEIAQKVFLRAPAGYVQGDICYDSPVDGRPITNRHARIEDLRRNGCVEWDPGMKQDAQRDRREAQESLDRAVDTTVEQAWAGMPTKKREALAAELHAGSDVEVKRETPN